MLYIIMPLYIKHAAWVRLVISDADVVMNVIVSAHDSRVSASAPDIRAHWNIRNCSDNGGNRSCDAAFVCHYKINEIINISDQ